MTPIRYLFILAFVVVENSALEEINTALSLSATKDNPVLLKILQTVDAATSNERLFDVTLKILKSLCVCMQETLRTKQLESYQLSQEMKSLQTENDARVANKKVLDLYQRIYNETCFDLREELAMKLNKSGHITPEEEKESMERSNCGKKAIEENTEAYKMLTSRATQVAENEASLRKILHTTFVVTRDYHKFRMRKFNLFKKSQKSTQNSAKHSIIVILTFYPHYDGTDKVDNFTKVNGAELNGTLYSHSPIDIDVIDTRYGRKENARDEDFIPKPATNCSLKSIYNFLLQSEQVNKTKVFKILRKKGTIKVYIDIPTQVNHIDYSEVCCRNETEIPLCMIDFSRESFDTHEITTYLPEFKKRKKNRRDYKNTISKIKSLVKLYDRKLNRNKMNQLNLEAVKNNTPKKFNNIVTSVGKNMQAAQINNDVNVVLEKEKALEWILRSKLNELRSVVGTVTVKNYFTAEKNIFPNNTSSDESRMNTVLENTDPGETTGLIRAIHGHKNTSVLQNKNDQALNVVKLITLPKLTVSGEIFTITTTPVVRRLKESTDTKKTYENDKTLTIFQTYQKAQTSTDDDHPTTLNNLHSNEAHETFTSLKKLNITEAKTRLTEKKMNTAAETLAKYISLSATDGLTKIFDGNAYINTNTIDYSDFDKRLQTTERYSKQSNNNSTILVYSNNSKQISTSVQKPPETKGINNIRKNNVDIIDIVPTNRITTNENHKTTTDKPTGIVPEMHTNIITTENQPNLLLDSRNEKSELQPNQFDVTGITNKTSIRTATAKKSIQITVDSNNDYLTPLVSSNSVENQLSELSMLKETVTTTAQDGNRHFRSLTLPEIPISSFGNNIQEKGTFPNKSDHIIIDKFKSKGSYISFDVNDVIATSTSKSFVLSPSSTIGTILNFELDPELTITTPKSKDENLIFKTTDAPDKNIKKSSVNKTKTTDIITSDEDFSIKAINEATNIAKEINGERIPITFKLGTENYKEISPLEALLSAATNQNDIANPFGTANLTNKNVMNSTAAENKVKNEYTNKMAYQIMTSTDEVRTMITSNLEDLNLVETKILNVTDAFQLEEASKNSDSHQMDENVINATKLNKTTKKGDTGENQRNQKSVMKPSKSYYLFNITEIVSATESNSALNSFKTTKKNYLSNDENAQTIDNSLTSIVQDEIKEKLVRNFSSIENNTTQPVKDIPEIENIFEKNTPRQELSRSLKVFNAFLGATRGRVETEYTDPSKYYAVNGKADDFESGEINPTSSKPFDKPILKIMKSKPFNQHSSVDYKDKPDDLKNPYSKLKKTTEDSEASFFENNNQIITNVFEEKLKITTEPFSNHRNSNVDTEETSVNKYSYFGAQDIFNTKTSIPAKITYDGDELGESETINSPNSSDLPSTKEKSGLDYFSLFKKLNKVENSFHITSLKVAKNGQDNSTISDGVTAAAARREVTTSIQPHDVTSFVINRGFKSSQQLDYSDYSGDAEYYVKENNINLLSTKGLLDKEQLLPLQTFKKQLKITFPVDKDANASSQHSTKLNLVKNGSSKVLTQQGKPDSVSATTPEFHYTTDTSVNIIATNDFGSEQRKNKMPNSDSVQYSLKTNKTRITRSTTVMKNPKSTYNQITTFITTVPFSDNLVSSFPSSKLQDLDESKVSKSPEPFKISKKFNLPLERILSNSLVAVNSSFNNTQMEVIMIPRTEKDQSISEYNKTITTYIISPNFIQDTYMAEINLKESMAEIDNVTKLEAFNAIGDEGNAVGNINNIVQETSVDGQEYIEKSRNFSITEPPPTKKINMTGEKYLKMDSSAKKQIYSINTLNSGLKINTPKNKTYDTKAISSETSYNVNFKETITVNGIKQTKSISNSHSGPIATHKAFDITLEPTLEETHTKKLDFHVAQTQLMHSLQMFDLNDNQTNSKSTSFERVINRTDSEDQSSLENIDNDFHKILKYLNESSFADQQSNNVGHNISKVKLKELNNLTVTQSHPASTINLTENISKHTIIPIHQDENINGTVKVTMEKTTDIGMNNDLSTVTEVIHNFESEPGITDKYIETSKHYFGETQKGKFLASTKLDRFDQMQDLTPLDSTSWSSVPFHNTETGDNYNSLKPITTDKININVSSSLTNKDTENNFRYAVTSNFIDQTYLKEGDDTTAIVPQFAKMENNSGLLWDNNVAYEFIKENIPFNDRVTSRLETKQTFSKPITKPDNTFKPTLNGIQHAEYFKSQDYNSSTNCTKLRGPMKDFTCFKIFSSSNYTKDNNHDKEHIYNISNVLNEKLVGEADKKPVNMPIMSIAENNSESHNPKFSASNDQFRLMPSSRLGIAYENTKIYDSLTTENAKMDNKFEVGKGPFKAMTYFKPSLKPIYSTEFENPISSQSTDFPSPTEAINYNFINIFKLSSKSGHQYTDNKNEDRMIEISPKSIESTSKIQETNQTTLGDQLTDDHDMFKIINKKYNVEVSNLTNVTFGIPIEPLNERTFINSLNKTATSNSIKNLFNAAENLNNIDTKYDNLMDKLKIDDSSFNIASTGGVLETKLSKLSELSSSTASKRVDFIKFSNIFKTLNNSKPDNEETINLVVTEFPLTVVAFDGKKYGENETAFSVVNTDFINNLEKTKEGIFFTTLKNEISGTKNYNSNNVEIPDTLNYTESNFENGDVISAIKKSSIVTQQPQADEFDDLRLIEPSTYTREFYMETQDKKSKLRRDRIKHLNKTYNIAKDIKKNNHVLTLNNVTVSYLTESEVQETNSKELFNTEFVKSKTKNVLEPPELINNVTTKPIIFDNYLETEEVSLDTTQMAEIPRTKRQMPSRNKTDFTTSKDDLFVFKTANTLSSPKIEFDDNIIPSSNQEKSNVSNLQFDVVNHNLTVITPHFLEYRNEAENSTKSILRRQDEYVTDTFMEIEDITALNDVAFNYKPEKEISNVSTKSDVNIVLHESQLKFKPSKKMTNTDSQHGIVAVPLEITTESNYDKSHTKAITKNATLTKNKIFINDTKSQDNHHNLTTISIEKTSDYTNSITLEKENENFMNDHKINANNLTEIKGMAEALSTDVTSYFNYKIGSMEESTEISTITTLHNETVNNITDNEILEVFSNSQFIKSSDETEKRKARKLAPIINDPDDRPNVIESYIKITTTRPRFDKVQGDENYPFQFVEKLKSRTEIPILFSNTTVMKRKLKFSNVETDSFFNHDHIKEILHTEKTSSSPNSNYSNKLSNEVTKSLPDNEKYYEVSNKTGFHMKNDIIFKKQSTVNNNMVTQTDTIVDSLAKNEIRSIHSYTFHNEVDETESLQEVTLTTTHDKTDTRSHIIDVQMVTEKLSKESHTKESLKDFPLKTYELLEYSPNFTTSKNADRVNYRYDFEVAKLINTAVSKSNIIELDSEKISNSLNHTHESSNLKEYYTDLQSTSNELLKTRNKHFNRISKSTNDGLEVNNTTSDNETASIRNAVKYTNNFHKRTDVTDEHNKLQTKQVQAVVIVNAEEHQSLRHKTDLETPNHTTSSAYITDHLSLTKNNINTSLNIVTEAYASNYYDGKQKPNVTLSNDAGVEVDSRNIKESIELITHMFGEIETATGSYNHYMDDFNFLAITNIHNVSDVKISSNNQTELDHQFSDTGNKNYEYTEKDKIFNAVLSTSKRELQKYQTIEINNLEITTPFDVTEKLRGKVYDTKISLESSTEMDQQHIATTGECPSTENNFASRNTGGTFIIPTPTTTEPTKMYQHKSTDNLFINEKLNFIETSKRSRDYPTDNSYSTKNTEMAYEVHDIVERNITSHSTTSNARFDGEFMLINKSTRSIEKKPSNAYEVETTSENRSEFNKKNISISTKEAMFEKNRSTTISNSRIIELLGKIRSSYNSYNPFNDASDLKEITEKYNFTGITQLNEAYSHLTDTKILHDVELRNVFSGIEISHTTEREHYPVTDQLQSKTSYYFEALHQNMKNVEQPNIFSDAEINRTENNTQYSTNIPSTGNNKRLKEENQTEIQDYMHSASINTANASTADNLSQFKVNIDLLRTILSNTSDSPIVKENSSFDQTRTETSGSYYGTEITNSILESPIAQNNYISERKMFSSLENETVSQKTLTLSDLQENKIYQQATQLPPAYSEYNKEGQLQSSENNNEFLTENKSNSITIAPITTLEFSLDEETNHNEKIIAQSENSEKYFVTSPTIVLSVEENLTVPSHVNTLECPEIVENEIKVSIATDRVDSLSTLPLMNENIISKRNISMSFDSTRPNNSAEYRKKSAMDENILFHVPPLAFQVTDLKIELVPTYNDNNIPQMIPKLRGKFNVSLKVDPKHVTDSMDHIKTYKQVKTFENTFYTKVRENLTLGSQFDTPTLELENNKVNVFEDQFYQLKAVNSTFDQNFEKPKLTLKNCNENADDKMSENTLSFNLITNERESLGAEIPEISGLQTIKKYAPKNSTFWDISKNIIIKRKKSDKFTTPKVEKHTNADKPAETGTEQPGDTSLLLEFNPHIDSQLTRSSPLPDQISVTDFYIFGTNLNKNSNILDDPYKLNPTTINNSPVSVDHRLHGITNNNVTIFNVSSFNFKNDGTTTINLTTSREVLKTFESIETESKVNQTFHSIRHDGETKYLISRRNKSGEIVIDSKLIDNNTLHHYEMNESNNNISKVESNFNFTNIKTVKSISSENDSFNGTNVIIVDGNNTSNTSVPTENGSLEQAKTPQNMTSPKTPKASKNKKNLEIPTNSSGHSLLAITKPLRNSEKNTEKDKLQKLAPIYQKGASFNKTNVQSPANSKQNFETTTSISNNLLPTISVRFSEITEEKTLLELLKMNQNLAPFNTINVQSLVNEKNSSTYTITNLSRLTDPKLITEIPIVPNVTTVDDKIIDNSSKKYENQKTLQNVTTTRQQSDIKDVMLENKVEYTSSSVKKSKNMPSVRKAYGSISLTEKSTKRYTDRDIENPKADTQTTVNLNVVQIPVSQNNRNKYKNLTKSNKQQNLKPNFVAFVNVNKETNLGKIVTMPGKTTHNPDSKIKYETLRSDQHVNVTSRSVLTTTKRIKYNTYRPLTEEELDPSEINKIISSIPQYYTKKVKTKNPQQVKNYHETPYGNKRKQETKQDVHNKSSIYDPLDKKNLYPIKKMITPRKVIKRLKLANKRNDIMTMNTKDFFSRRLGVTQKDKIGDILKLYPKPVLKLRPVTNKPKIVLLRPKFSSFDTLTQKPSIIKPVILQNTDVDYFRGLNSPHYRRSGPIWSNIENNMPGDLEVPLRAGFGDPVIDVPYYIPTIMKPKFLREKVNSIRSYIYNAEKKPNYRRHFMNEPDDADDGNDSHVQYSKRNSWDDEDTDVPLRRYTRPKKTIFFLSPTVPYNRYF